MLVVTVVGLPTDLSQEVLVQIKKAIKEDVVSVKELDIKEDQVSIVLLGDMLINTDPNLEVIATITGLIKKPVINEAVRNILALKVVHGLKSVIWGAGRNVKLVACSVVPFDPEQGFASYP